MNEQCSVTSRIKTIKQPWGGYLSPKEFVEVKLDDDRIVVDEENIHASIIGLVVDYMTRFLIGTSKEEAFKISLKGVKSANKLFNLNMEKMRYNISIKSKEMIKSQLLMLVS